MDKSVIKPMLPMLLATVLVACQKEEPEVAAPVFERQSHVENCLPALLALDTIAEEAAGTQLGQRVTKAPWLRLDSELIANRDSVPLSSQSLGPVIMPMLFKAQTALKAEIAAIDAETLSEWSKKHDITQPAESFMDYCSREAAFAQWRDPKNTIPWIKGLALEPENRGWLASWLTRSVTPVTEETTVVEWREYVPPAPSGARVALSADANGVKRVAQKSEMPLLQRYAPVWSLPKTSAASLVDLTWDKHVTAGKQQASYAYIDYAQALSQRLIRLNYITWWQLDGELNGLLYRMTITQRGKPVTVEVLNLDGSAYQLYVQQGFDVGELPEKLTAISTKLKPKMGVFVDETASVVTQIKGGGGGDRTPYSMTAFTELMALGDGETKHSAFDKEGVLDASQSYQRFVSWLTGVPKVGLPRKPSMIMIDGQQLAFDDPKLLEGFGLKKSG